MAELTFTVRLDRGSTRNVTCRTDQSVGAVVDRVTTAYATQADIDVTKPFRFEVDGTPVDQFQTVGESPIEDGDLVDVMFA